MYYLLKCVFPWLQVFRVCGVARECDARRAERWSPARVAATMRGRAALAAALIILCSLLSTTHASSAVISKYYCSTFL